MQVLQESGVSSPRYHLPRHVYVCRTDEAVIFLDARRDRYFGLGRASVGSLAELVDNWPGHDVARRTAEAIREPPADLWHLADGLVGRGLLCVGRSVERRSEDKALPALAIDPPQRMEEVCRAPRVSDFANFVLAWLKARRRLKRSSLESIASQVTAARRGSGHSDFAESLELVQVFRRLRALVYSEKNRCLLNALSLVYFLQRYGHFPRFVIGVKTAPFAAHSWVQQEHVLLEGDPASICHFVPILVA